MHPHETADERTVGAAGRPAQAMEGFRITSAADAKAARAAVSVTMHPARRNAARCAWQPCGARSVPYT